MKKLLFILITLHLVLCAQSQSTDQPPTTGQVKIEYKYYADSTVIRWGYDHPQLWFVQLHQPVTIWRRDVTNKGEYEKLADVMPWDSSRIELAASRAADPGMLVVVLENMYRHWENTLFDGYGSILEHNDNFFNRWSLTHLAAERNASAAYAAGLRYADTKRKAGTTYAYKVVTFENTSSDYTVAFPTVRDFKPILFDVEEGDSVVTLHWERKLHDYHFSSYWIEQSADGNRFDRLNAAPFIQMTDANVDGDQRFYSYPIQVKNYQPRYFRIIGLDAFADESKPSDKIKAMGRDRTPPAAPFLMADTMQLHLMKHFTWTHDHPTDVDHYALERSFANSTVIIPKFAKGNATAATDTLTIEGIYKYRLIAVDTAGNSSYSEPVYTKVYDLIPPSKPVAPHAIADTAGYIQIAWPVHAEPDVIGYHIYAADGKDRHFTRLNQHIYREHFYTDSIQLHLLTEMRFYYIVAVDNDYLLSEPSDTVAVKRPDVIPPAPALIGDYKVLPEGIRITILPSSSRDVVRHELRRSSATDSMSTIATFTSIPGSYLDTTVVAETEYTYRVVAIDDDSLTSHSVKDLVITSMHAVHLAPLLTYELNGNMIKLLVDQTDSAAQSFAVYQSRNGDSFQQSGKFEGTSTEMILHPGVAYRYRVRSIPMDGRPAPFSNEITVQLPTQ